MDRIRIRDPYKAVFEIDPSALPFWQNREGYEVLDIPGDEPAQAEPAQVQPEPSGALQPTKKAASRPASENKE